LLAIGTSYETGALTASTNLKVSAVGPQGCESVAELFEVLVDDSNPSANVAFNVNGGAQICQDTEAEVEITNPVAGMTYRWYESSSGTEAIHEGTTLPATTYADNQSYYLGAVNANGCETTAAARKQVDVQVVKFTEPEIDNSTYGVLSSSTAQAYQWYVNGEPISGEVDQSIRVLDPGHYAVQVDLLGCEAWSNTIFTTDLITSLSDESRIIRFFPNPTSDKITVHVLGNEPVSGQLLDDQGRAISSIHMMQGDNQWSGELDVRSFARGLYLLRLSSGTRSVTHKVILK
jgi:hypothetical protein